MRWLLLMALVAAVVGCGSGSKIDKPENPVPKFDMTPDQQKKAGDFAP